MKKILHIFGTRPEAIKMAPLIKAFAQHPKFESKVCVTGQHREMLDQVLDLFEIKPDYDLRIMSPGQTINEVTSKILLTLQPILVNYKPDLVLVHGDTATTFAASLASFYEKIDVGHVEAGLRTGNMYSPFPEEINRKLTGGIAKMHFTPTELSRTNLLDEGILSDNICVCGNTVIDALLLIKQKITSDKMLQAELASKFNFINFNKDIVLVTGHRRENFGSGFEEICKALMRLAESQRDIQIVYPVHLNPSVQAPVQKYLRGYSNIHLIEPLEYLPFTFLMTKSTIILTDSGGIQEEAPSLGIPVLLMRENTERPEAVKAGTVKLVGTSAENIVKNSMSLLSDQKMYEKMSKSENPYGAGDTSSKIVEWIRKYYAN
jgi:UDP-N-acetylglucosamine 2-epimerase (non-hydrolysing)